MNDSETTGQGIDERVLAEAEFLPSAPMFHTVQASIGYGVMALIGLVLAPFTFGITLLLVALAAGLFFFTRWYYVKYYERMSCTLTDRKLLIGRGVWNRTEQAVPLDKITDMQMNQSFIMRWLDLEAIRVETAGQSNMIGGLAGIVGVKDSRGFRAAVLRQRDRTVGTADRGEAPAAAPSPGADLVLVEIRDALLRIEESLQRNGQG
ncbi:MAG: PH domain-containing protein [Phycisphaerales bacterium]